MDNIIFFIQKTGGISTYWYELLKRQINENDDVVFFEENITCQNIFRKKLNIPLEKVIINPSRLPLNLRKYLSLNTGNLSRESIFHSSYYRVSNVAKCQVTTVHDFIYERFASGLAKVVHVAQKKRAIEKADAIICISQNTKTDLLKLYPKFLNKRIEVVYNGVSDAFYPKYDRQDNVILYVGGRVYYKNFPFVVEIVCQLQKHQLVIVGNPLNTKEKKMLETKLKDRYKIYSYISEEKLNDLYNQASCLVYPSSYEGFGIPVVEAMRTGCPVITLNTSSLPEICGEAGMMLNELSSLKFIEQIKYTQKNIDTITKASLIQSQKFSWSKCFNETNEIYKSLQ
ncbi:MAG: glycosyltransferase family 4 protein [Candidatus Azobacteroides sp.]|nr:glycosyltransferase family 4 protein [Candidatus Azobacteroides sp.]